ncbi:MAG: type I methionyl aminopeptidase [Spirochaetales bacterium]|jgi:methionyl aminopeptidase|nr:type I methionyl aminopeptidase [Spirochaetales bacterium]
MICFKNETDIEGIRESCNLLSRLLKELRGIVGEGITTKEIDAFVRKRCREMGARPAFLDYNGFPAAICTSPNETVIHGIPSKRKLRQGDILSLDCGLDYKGFFSDAAFTLPIGQVSSENQLLMKVTRECLDLAVQKAVCGNRVSDISRAVYEHAKKHNFGVVREYCGHGVGFSQHEDPQIPNYIAPGPSPRLKAGMVIAIEPMINAGTNDVKLLKDEWTVVTADGRCSAHFEHTLAIFADHTDVLTAWQ